MRNIKILLVGFDGKIKHSINKEARKNFLVEYIDSDGYKNRLFGDNLIELVQTNNPEVVIVDLAVGNLDPAKHIKPKVSKYLDSIETPRDRPFFIFLAIDPNPLFSQTWQDNCILIVRKSDTVEFHDKVAVVMRKTLQADVLVFSYEKNEHNSVCFSESFVAGFKRRIDGKFKGEHVDIHSVSTKDSVRIEAWAKNKELAEKYNNEFEKLYIEWEKSNQIKSPNFISDRFSPETMILIRNIFLFILALGAIAKVISELLG